MIRFKDEIKKKGQKRPPRYTDPELLAWRLAEYMKECYEAEKPLLISGLYRCTGMRRDVFFRYGNGENDHCKSKTQISMEGDVNEYLHAYRQKDELYPYFCYMWFGAMPPIGTDVTARVVYAIEHKYDIEFSDIIQNARLLLEEDVEQRLVNGKVGDIMRAKVILGWQDEKVQVQKIEMPKDEKEKRLEALGYKKLGEPIEEEEDDDE